MTAEEAARELIDATHACRHSTEKKVLDFPCECVTCVAAAMKQYSNERLEVAKKACQKIANEFTEKAESESIPAYRLSLEHGAIGAKHCVKAVDAMKEPA